MTKGRFSKPFEGRDGRWYFNLKASNGRVVLASEGYETKSHANRGIKAAVKAADEAVRRYSLNREAG